MCIGVNSSGQPNISGSSVSPAIGTCTANTKRIALRRLSKMRRPRRTARTSVPKSSSSSTSEADSRATSVPRPPIAMPMCAAFKEGASLTPSPVIATTSPLAFSASTILSFCCGATRAKTVVVVTARRSSVSLSAATSSPRSSPDSPSMPACRAIASAVPGWSPVIITTRMPACRHSRTACGTLSRSGSARATRPRNRKANPRESTGHASAPQGAAATPSTRMPRPASRLASASTDAD